MKKLKLNLANLQGTEVLTREQLKKVMGGDMGSGGAGTSGNDGMTNSIKSTSSQSLTTYRSNSVVYLVPVYDTTADYAADYLGTDHTWD